MCEEGDVAVTEAVHVSLNTAVSEYATMPVVSVANAIVVRHSSSVKSQTLFMSFSIEVVDLCTDSILPYIVFSPILLCRRCKDAIFFLLLHRKQHQNAVTQ